MLSDIEIASQAKMKKIGEIAETFGYTPYSFSKAFKKEFGVSPKTLQKTD